MKLDLGDRAFLKPNLWSDFSKTGCRLEFDPVDAISSNLCFRVASQLSCNLATFIPAVYCFVVPVPAFHYPELDRGLAEFARFA